MSDQPKNEGAAVAVRAPQTQSMIAPMFTQEQVQILKRTVCPPETTDDEFKLFLFQCDRSGLDPFRKQMFCVPRRKKTPSGGYITVHEAQPAEAGLLARAMDFPDYRGVLACAVYEGDKIELDFAQGVVKHSFNPIDPKRIKLLGAWARIDSDGSVPLLVWRAFDAKAFGNTGASYTMTPQTWIEKIARVAALRTKYPKQFGGLYIAEEVAPVRAAAPPAAGPRTLGDLTPQKQPQAAPAEPAFGIDPSTVQDAEPTRSDTVASGEGAAPGGLDAVAWGEDAEERHGVPPEWINERCGMGKSTMTAADGSKKPARDLTWADLMAGKPDGQRRKHLERLAEGDDSWIDDPTKCSADEDGKHRLRLLVDKCAERARIVLDMLAEDGK